MLDDSQLAEAARKTAQCPKLFFLAKKGRAVLTQVSGDTTVKKTPGLGQGLVNERRGCGNAVHRLKLQLDKCSRVSLMGESSYRLV